LSSVKDQNSALIEGFTYDATGNRLSKQLGAAPAVPYSYAATDHKLTNAGTGARSFDANGNSTQIPGTGTMAYDERNRLNSVVGTATRTSKYNARGERVLSTVSAVNTLTVFSEGGQLLSEGPAASTSSAVIYLDSMPVARVKAGVINPIEADHLGSPRNMQATAGTSSVWTWNLMANTATGSNAFGEQAASGTVTDFNLRFPGQYSDGNGLFYNYFRDYEAGSGRYVESDPIGLRGGVSTFGYVRSQPFNLVDSYGKSPAAVAFADGILIWIGTDVAIPEPSDVLPPKWLVYAGGALIAGGILYVCSDTDPCDRKAPKGFLKPYGGGHGIKGDYGVGIDSRFDVCMCRDGRLVIKPLGCKGDIVGDTGLRWK
jgi:RHS repeat-associated protein